MKKFLCYDTNDATSGKINVSTNGVLKPNSTVPPLSNGSASYQQLVTDSNGNTKWEDRLAYDDSKLVVDAGQGVKFVKVADEVPSWVSIDAPMKVWMRSGESDTLSVEDYRDFGNGSFSASGASLFIMTNNFELNGIVFPGKGVYFLSTKDDYTTGISSADSDTPEITWDGNIGVIKKIDEKFLPEQPVQAELPVFTIETSGSTVHINYLVDAEGNAMTVEQAKTIGLNFVVQTDEGITKPISMKDFNDYVCFYIPQVGEGTLNSIACYTEGYSLAV